MSATVLLAGATGYIGAQVARELVQAGYRLVCPVRDRSSKSARQLTELAPPPLAPTGLADGNAGAAPEHAPAPASPHHDASVTLLEVSYEDAAALDAALAGQTIDFVVSCLASRSGSAEDSERVEYRANRLLLDWALAHAVRHFTLLSAICVQRPRLAFQRAKLRFEAELQASGMKHSIVRPTAFFKSLSGQLERVRAGKAFLVFGDGDLTRCKPIGEADLARYLRRTLEDTALHGVLPIGGPGPAISPRDQARILGELLGRPVRTRSVPPGLLAGIARVLDVLGLVSRRMADKAEFARIGHYYATESMLLWDAEAQRYDAEATPEFGDRTLEESYRAQLDGRERQDLGEHAVF